jgi:peptidoglycan L-alanyl-D-glutamate endopeptidase CwlK
MNFKLSNKSISNMDGIEYILIMLAKRAIEISVIDFGIPSSGGLRSPSQQKELFDNNKSKADGVIKTSRHQYGEALDFYAYVGGKASWDKGHLAQVACAFLQAANEQGIKIEWGGLWSNFPDFPHIQLKK